MSADTCPVILVRHAHAEWPDWSGRDFDRPLTPRGERDAHGAAVAIGAAGHRPTLVLASPALRTRQTAGILMAQLGLPEAALRLVDDLYNAPGGTLVTELRRHCVGAGTLMLVAHNPGISEAARMLSRDTHAPPFSPADWRLLGVTGFQAG